MQIILDLIEIASGSVGFIDNKNSLHQNGLKSGVSLELDKIAIPANPCT